MRSAPRAQPPWLGIHHSAHSQSRADGQRRGANLGEKGPYRCRRILLCLRDLTKWVIRSVHAG